MSAPEDGVVAQLREEIVILKTTIADRDLKLAEFEEQEEILRRNIESGETRKGQLEQELAEMQEGYRSVSDCLEQTNALLSEANSEGEGWRKNFETVKKQLEEAQRQVKSYLAQIKDYEPVIEQIANNLQMVSRREEALRIDFNKARVKCQRFQTIFWIAVATGVASVVCHFIF
ncbi:MAG: hypothetical protein ISS36_03720 [Candidatus Aenigmarchaeota archaeon]|nr:hypothetical protein [Candidatus Aenigmarchaeota archaeon]